MCSKVIGSVDCAKDFHMFIESTLKAKRYVCTGLNANITQIFFTFPRELFRAFFVVEKVVAANGNLLKQFSSATLSGNYPSCNMQATFDKKLPSSPFAVWSLVERWKSEGEKLKR